MSITAYVITFNETDNIRACLGSLLWCDEIVVVDSFSTDDTVEIARSMGARVIQREWPGFLAQKQFGLSRVETEWGISLDADERVSKPLRESIERVVAEGDRSINGYRIPKLNYHIGRFWPHGIQHRSRRRLSRPAFSRWEGGAVHPFLSVDGKVGRLSEPLIHLQRRDLAQQADTFNRYSTVQAREMFEAGERAGAWDVLSRPVARFLRAYVTTRNYRMGVAGLVHSLEQASYVFYKYAKLWEQSAEPEPTDSPPVPIEQPSRGQDPKP